jgi:hypothetical protein
MANFFRIDRWITDALGNALAGVNVAICSQPANTTTLPPSPLVALYADPNGVTPVTNPLVTDGVGHAFAYLAGGVYTIMSYAPGVLTIITPDQTVTSPEQAGYNNDSSNAGTITGAINGTNTVFVLSATPAPASTLIFVVNGLIQAGYTVSGSTVTLAVAPSAGSTLNGLYQIAI